MLSSFSRLCRVQPFVAVSLRRFSVNRELEKEVDFFFSSVSQSNKGMTLLAITGFMDKQLVSRHFTYEEHLNFSPILDELVVYAKSSLNQTKQPTIEQLMTLLKFGHSFQIQDTQYLRQVQKTIEVYFTQHSKIPLETMLEVATYLK